MADGLVLSIDAMSGDHAPNAEIEGVVIAARKRPDARFLLHGDSAKIGPLLDAHPEVRAACEIRHCDAVIGMDVKPSQAMRQGKGSSLWNAVVSVEAGEARAVVSSGNTGAYMAIAMFRLRMMEGVHRPALVARWPSAQGHTAVLDVGANVEADASQLVEFAIMGEAFQRAITGKARPTVGLLNVGSEDQKGHEEIRAAARLVREAQLDFDFRGFVEGSDISKGTVDVVVTDGFSGNIALKTAEGTARLIGGFLRDALSAGVLARLGGLLAYPALQQLKGRMDPDNSNGGVFVGLNGLVVKSHGGASGPGFAAAVEVAARLADSHYRDEIKANLARLAGAEREATQAAVRDAL